jgi:formate--tetrahydrofolate ligase
MHAANSGTAKPAPLYTADTPLADKVETIARKVYGAEGVTFTDVAKEKLDRFTRLGFASFSVCIAKTPMSFTADPKQTGAPTGWTLPVSDLTLSAGAEYVVAIAGTTVLMPGLGKEPQAMKML